ncbi:MAG: shikimate kinase [Bacillota bacterium]|nr:shikimate kinase [Bacillota bacterium]
MPACGKSVTGVLLAKALRMKFVDADLLIQETTGKSLQEIIDQEGTDRFKKIEEQVLLSINAENTVIATGGSAVYYPKAMAHLKENAVTVYIETPLEVVKERLRNIKTRGVAMKKGQTLEDLYRMRVPLYERYEDVRVVSDHDSMEQTVADILSVLKDHEFR